MLSKVATISPAIACRNVFFDSSHSWARFSTNSLAIWCGAGSSSTEMSLMAT